MLSNWDINCSGLSVKRVARQAGFRRSIRMSCPMGSHRIRQSNPLADGTSVQGSGRDSGPRDIRNLDLLSLREDFRLETFPVDQSTTASFCWCLATSICIYTVYGFNSYSTGKYTLPAIYAHGYTYSHVWYSLFGTPPHTVNPKL